MKITFKTNLDAYNNNMFPQNLVHVPAKGSCVEVVGDARKAHLRSRKLPIRLEVVGVTHTDTAVICELWYSRTDAEVATANGAKIFG